MNMEGGFNTNREAINGLATIFERNFDKKRGTRELEMMTEKVEKREWEVGKENLNYDFGYANQKNGLIKQ